jgi:DNA-binding transcriptional regulator YiaG
MENDMKLTPVEFAERHTGPLYPWQREMLERIEKMTPQQLLDFRARHKLSQRAAAKRTGTAYGSWHNWEKGKTAPPAWVSIVFAAVDAGIA